MRDGGIGRILVAALHQGIADQLPSRLEFYENWLTPVGLRQGTIGLAAVTAVLSFLRREEEGAYERVNRRAGEFAAEWTIDGLNPLRRRFIRAMPRPLRRRVAVSVAGDLVRATGEASRARIRFRRWVAEVSIRGSVFCGVREPSSQPLCVYYAAAVVRVLSMLDLPSTVRVAGCRGMGERSCRLLVAQGTPQRRPPSESDVPSSQR